MSDFEKLVIKLEADTSRFEAALERASAKANELSSAVEYLRSLGVKVDLDFDGDAESKPVTRSDVREMIAEAIKSYDRHRNVRR